MFQADEAFGKSESFIVPDIPKYGKIKKLVIYLLVLIMWLTILVYLIIYPFMYIWLIYLINLLILFIVNSCVIKRWSKDNKRESIKKYCSAKNPSISTDLTNIYPQEETIIKKI